MAVFRDLARLAISFSDRRASSLPLILPNGFLVFSSAALPFRVVRSCQARPSVSDRFRFGDQDQNRGLRGGQAVRLDKTGIRRLLHLVGRSLQQEVDALGGSGYGAMVLRLKRF